ncbi:hypothetical protein ASPWEDRAFT_151477 [Aspergillus wentii DTO 134E9]|uniref:Major facilitator superfamily (MFS) profile domain-containing protein n=1 Tax=Aspergillus wentii DTO 134E9 TaxID=1073089 RepID=A0A1L9RYF7_ASPWE|nr:uncharacterized protein ASPWEDRAFT_151477 [Aspergillus wentii DTO 134E9]OJJ39933.1 hypothetical protein ASPWEDRAFT_151477 [Aspergillus wentii DTO 134E9]
MTLKPVSDVSPTEWEWDNLRHVYDDIPIKIFLVAIAELAERFTYRSVSAPIQNYIQHPRYSEKHTGALGKGQTVATGISYFFVGWSYFAPILGAIAADSYFGRYKTIALATGFGSIGVLILFTTSLPDSLDHGAGLPGLMIALVLIGMGTGGIKSNVSPLIAEQFSQPARIKTLSSGEKVVVDPNVTVQTIYSRYYWVINIGSLSVIPASWLELKVDFWAAFMLPLALWGLAAVALLAGRKNYIAQTPKESVITKTVKVFWISIKNGFNLDAARGSVRDDTFISELRRALVACRAFPIYWICNGQANNNLVSQASTMKTYGIPNDMLSCFNPIAIIAALPLVEYIVYPTLRRYGIPFRPISRMTAGFVTIACGIAYTAGLQEYIYRSSPCHRHPDTPECLDYDEPSNVSILLQIPAYSLIGLSELFSILSAMEYAFTKAPKSMRSIVTSIFLLTSTIGSMLGITLAPVSTNPKVLVEYASLSGIMFMTAVLFQLVFRKYNKTEEAMNLIGDSSSMSDENEKV